MAKLLLAAMAVACVLGFVPPALADCGADGVKVSGTAEEVAVACDALADVRDYFGRLGYTLEPSVKISFEEEVLLDVDQGDDYRVSGCFNAPLHEIEVTSWTSASQAERRPWGIEWGREIVASITRHELVHMAISEVLGEQDKRVGVPWHEFIAYAVQLELMDPALRNKILEKYSDLSPFASPDHVNVFLHGADPDAFGVRSYLYAQEHGGIEFIRHILSGEVSFDTRAELLLCR